MRVSHGGSYTHYWLSHGTNARAKATQCHTQHLTSRLCVLLVTDVRLHKNLLAHTTKCSKRRHTHFCHCRASMDAACWINSGPHVCLAVSSCDPRPRVAKTYSESKILNGDLDILKTANSWFYTDSYRPSSKLNCTEVLHGDLQGHG